VRINVRIGTRLEHDTAQAQIFRAHRPLSETRLASVAREGIAYSASRIEGIAALAVPVFQADQVVATLALVGTVTTIEAARTSAVGASLRRIAGELSADLGHEPTLPAE